MSGLAGAYDLKDEKQAKEYLDNLGVEYRYQCYQENIPEGCHRLGDFLEAFKNDHDKARKVYETNCNENKFGQSCFKLGNYTLVGRGGEAETSKAFNCFMKGCDYEYGPSCHNAGLLSKLGKDSVKKDIHSAVKFYEKGCELGNTPSCQELSTLYIANKDLPRDFAKAFQFAEKACEQGHMYACANLSVMYKKGDGVAKNLDMAEQYKKKAKAMYASQVEPEKQIEFGK